MYKFLVVDDDRTSLTVACAALTRWQYDVRGANDAQEALTMLRTESFDLVLSDVQMPGMDGFQLLEQIKQEFKLPVILFSANEKEEIAINAVRKGAVSFFLKPLKVKDVKDMHKYVEKSKMETRDQGKQDDPEVVVSSDEK